MCQVARSMKHGRNCQDNSARHDAEEKKDCREGNTRGRTPTDDEKSAMEDGADSPDEQIGEGHGEPQSPPQEPIERVEDEKPRRIMAMQDPDNCRPATVEDGGMDRDPSTLHSFI